MKQKIFAFLLIAGMTTFMTGCVKTADGHMKAGVPFAKDKIYSRYERSVDQIVDAARVVLKNNGQIQNDDGANKSLKAKVNDRTVWIKSTKVDDKISEVVVQVRKKTGGGDIYMASELSKQIALQLASQ
ncbi:MAG: hypothetical protein JWM68_2364 [Verrucomicrobiales bacterium]|nr:hypothetical protein [Verrucomicrobiales bacterium]